MKGTTYKRKLPSGRIDWCLGIDVGKDENGKRRRIFKSGFRRQGDADDELRRIMREMDEGTLVKPDPRTVAEFLDQWIVEYATRKVAPTTLERYRDLAGHMTRAIGSVELTKVTTLQLQRVYNGLLDSGRKNGTGLAVKTVGTYMAWSTSPWRPPSNGACLRSIPPTRATCRRFHSAKRRRWIRTAPRSSWRPVLAIGCGTCSRRRLPRAPAVANYLLSPGPTLISAPRS